ncbi:MAG: MarR family winged helix-turn-helix transcriptional regulator [Micrococcaceae bacterium]
MTARPESSRIRDLAFDPIEEARSNWIRQGWEDVADPMAAVTSVVRVQQILINQANETLKPFSLTFARFELLALLSFSHEQRLLMSKASARLQVHPTSVTHTADRLEKDGLVERRSVEADRRAVLLVLTDQGHRVAREAAEALNRNYFSGIGLSLQDSRELFQILRKLRVGAGDFTDAADA